VTTGVYTDDIDTAFRESLLKSAGMLAVVWCCCGHRQRGQQEPAPHHRRRSRVRGRSHAHHCRGRPQRGRQGACLRPAQHPVLGEEHAAARWPKPSAKSATAPTPSPPRRARSPAAIWTCRRAPNRRPARWRKPPRRWKN
jgi:hypothetical protein